MKAKVVECQFRNLKAKFPLIAQCNAHHCKNTIVLFTDEYTGTVIADPGIDSELGEYSELWTSCFEADIWDILDKVTVTFES